ncbi:carboxymuconolactone decarboxylase family protein [Maricaulis sp. CAU 1757]
MAYYPSLDEGDHLEALWRRFPRGVAPLLDLHDALLRAPGDLAIADRELIAAYVSGLNACRFCYGAHRTMAEAFGHAPDFVETLVSDGPQAAGVEPRLVPLLAYVRQLTEAPARVTAADTEAVLAAGWSEDALYLASQITALYAFMNRILDGAGIEPKALFEAPDAEELEARRNGTYVEWGRQAGLVP